MQKLLIDQQYLSDFQIKELRGGVVFVLNLELMRSSLNYLQSCFLLTSWDVEHVKQQQKPLDSLN